MRSKAFWLQTCRMTCMGGSEQGTCPCEKPQDCQANSDSEFIKYRELAISRMGRFLMSGLHPDVAAALHEKIAEEIRLMAEEERNGTPQR